MQNLTLKMNLKGHLAKKSSGKYHEGITALLHVFLYDPAIPLETLEFLAQHLGLLKATLVSARHLS
jgi:hypothetical protein